MDLSNENIIHIKKENIEYLQFKKLLNYKKINHGYAIGLDKNFRIARAMGKEISQEEYNLTEKSYQEICDALGIETKDIIKANQTHSKNVEIINEKNELNKNKDFYVVKNTDGLVTNKSQNILSTTNADCILFMFYDPEKNVVANVHSGWRGTLQRISIETINKMEDEFQCNRKDIICCICPSIRKCHFEVDYDVYKMFFDEFSDLRNEGKNNEKKDMWNEIVEYDGHKWKIDTVEINKLLLKRAGLEKENIIDSEICSVCNSDLIHSCRAEGEKYGLSTALISII